jgi:hypothetical protein
MRQENEGVMLDGNDRSCLLTFLSLAFAAKILVGYADRSRKWRASAKWRHIEPDVGNFFGRKPSSKLDGLYVGLAEHSSSEDQYR